MSEPKQIDKIDNGNIYMFCNFVDKDKMCIRGIGHNGLHAMCYTQYIPMIPIILVDRKD